MKYLKLLILAACISMLCGCTAQNRCKKTIYAMDTVMQLEAYGENAEMAIDMAQTEIYRLDSLFDRGDGELAKINHSKGCEASEEVIELVKEALEICRSTDGSFDISVAPLMDLWGFYKKEFRVPSTEEISECLTYTGYENIEVNGNTVKLKNRVQLDLGAIAKGYTSRRIREIFNEHEIKSGLISLGGNVETVGKKPDGSKWNVAIQDPRKTDEYIGVLQSSDNAVVTSGDYQRFFEENGVRYHHIINPSTGYPVQSGVSSVTVVCEDGAKADALSTAIFVMGKDKGIEYWRNNGGFELILTGDGIYITEGLEHCFSSEKKYEIIRK